jgi:hypothetical protein
MEFSPAGLTCEWLHLRENKFCAARACCRLDSIFRLRNPECAGGGDSLCHLLDESSTRASTACVIACEREAASALALRQLRHAGRGTDGVFRAALIFARR